MLYTVMFDIQKMSDHGSRWPEYRWWNEFVDRFFIIGQDFEIRCWEEDIEGIEAANRFGTEVANPFTKEKVYQGKISEDMLQEIHTQYLSKTGNLKWFSLFIHCPTGEKLSCEHYGEEMYLIDCEKKTAEDVRLWAMKFECFRTAWICKQE